MLKETDFKKKLFQIRQGKEVFEKKFQVSGLDLNDCFVLILTKSEECIYYAARYLPDFIELYQKRKVYILMEDTRYTTLFLRAGGEVKLCTNWELQRLAEYLNVFHQKECIETKIVFITEKDGQGLFVEKLLEKEAFSLEEYVAISLYQLGGIREG